MSLKSKPQKTAVSQSAEGRLVEPVTLTLALILGVVGGALVVNSDSPSAMANRHSSKLYRVQIGEDFGATAFALKVESGVKLVTAGHVCDSLMNPKIPKNLERSAVSDDKSTKFTLDPSKFVISGSTDLCVLADLPSETKAFSLSSAESSVADAWSIGYPAGLPLSAVKGHITGMTDVEMPAGRPQERCTGESYSWKKVKIMTPFGPMEPTLCIFKSQMLASTLTVAPGNSGSPVVDKMGNVVGVISALNGNVPAGFAVIVPLENMQKEVK